MFKKPIYDYREFRLSRLNDPRFAHVKLLGGWIIYFSLYFLTENLIPPEVCTPIHCAVDDLIPFCEYFAVPYYLWYALCVFTLLYFLLYDVDSFKRVQTYIMITQLIAMICYILWPSRQDLRPEVFPRDNFLTSVVQFLYSFDTSTGVCPSLHVAYSLGIGSVWLKYKDAPVGFKIFMVLFILVICISTAFIKQHSFLDIVAAFPVGLVAEIFVFHVIPFKKSPIKRISEPNTQ
ncbi:MAG: phosphatidic acid phosphatase [Firmicutes bacterium]|nr:phosphatidic acid phosphatase [Bacillota bacterium]